MRIILKIFLFPVWVSLSLLLLPCKFLCYFGTALLSIFSFLLFSLSLLGIFVLGDVGRGIQVLFLSSLISPYGIPLVIGGLIELVDGISERLRAI